MMDLKRLFVLLRFLFSIRFLDLVLTAMKGVPGTLLNKTGLDIG